MTDVSAMSFRCHVPAEKSTSLLSLTGNRCWAEGERSLRLNDGFRVEANLSETRNVTVCNKCPRRSLIMTLIPGCDLEHSQGTSLAQDVTCHFVLLFCVTLTLGKEP